MILAIQPHRHEKYDFLQDCDGARLSTAVSRPTATVRKIRRYRNGRPALKQVQGSRLDPVGTESRQANDGTPVNCTNWPAGFEA